MKIILIIPLLLISAWILAYTLRYEDDMRFCKKNNPQYVCNSQMNEIYYTTNGIAFGSKK